MQARKTDIKMNTINHGLKLEIRRNHKLEIRGIPCSNISGLLKHPIILINLINSEIISLLFVLLGKPYRKM